MNKRIGIPKETLAEILSQKFSVDAVYWDVQPDGEFVGVWVTGGDSDTEEQLRGFGKLAGDA